MLNSTDISSNVISIQNQRCSMTYRPLSHNERVKINQALDARNACIGIEDVLMQSYEWTGKKEGRPAFDVFLESEKEILEFIDNKDPNEIPYCELTPQETMDKLNKVLGEGENVWTSYYEFYFGEQKTSNPLARKDWMRFFSSRVFRLEKLRNHIAEGEIINIDDSEEIKKLFERLAFKHNMISEAKAAVIRARPTPKFQ